MIMGRILTLFALTMNIWQVKAGLTEQEVTTLLSLPHPKSEMLWELARKGYRQCKKSCKAQCNTANQNAWKTSCETTGRGKDKSLDLSKITCKCVSQMALDGTADYSYLNSLENVATELQIIHQSNPDWLAFILELAVSSRAADCKAACLTVCPTLQSKAVKMCQPVYNRSTRTKKINLGQVECPCGNEVLLSTTTTTVPMQSDLHFSQSYCDDQGGASAATAKSLLAQNGCIPEVAVADEENCAHNCNLTDVPTLSGVCNNKQHFLAGAALTSFKSSRDTSCLHGSDTNLPLARDVSLFLQQVSDVKSTVLNQMMMQWGQFITHDIVKTSLHPNESCTECSANQDVCLHIPTKLCEDPMAVKFGCVWHDSAPRCCVNAPATAKVCGKETHDQSETQTMWQLNELTSVIDGSVVYGSTQAEFRELLEDGVGPFLQTSSFNGNECMPGKFTGCTDAANMTDCKATFKAGDDRVNVFVGLGVLHNVFVLEHNRIVAQLLTGLTDNAAILQTARSIVTGLIQSINEDWLEKLLGSPLPEYPGYNPELKPIMMSEVSGAALRVGHAMLNGQYPLVDNAGNEVDRLSFLGALKNSKMVLSNSENFMRGMFLEPSRIPIGLVQEVGSDLFFRHDLGAMNIQRGRALCLGSYRFWRLDCGLSDFTDFASLASIFSPDVDLVELESLYDNDPGKIDLFAGILLEKKTDSNLVGETASCLLRRQFEVLRNGDRFWYQNGNTVFNSEEKRRIIKEQTLRAVLCRNLPDLHKVPSDSFHVGAFADWQSCSDVQGFDLRLNPWMGT